MGLNARSKGQRGERMAIQFMKDWTNMDFKRTPGSGGLRGHVSDYTEGDIVCVKKNYIFPLCLEVKNYAELNFSHLLYDARPNKKKKVDRGIKGFWKQCVSSAKRAEKIPILLMRYNRLPKDVFFVMMRSSFFLEIHGSPGKLITPKKFFTFNDKYVIMTTRELKKYRWDRVDKVAKLLLGIK
jgi:hypothetical protein